MLFGRKNTTKKEKRRIQGRIHVEHGTSNLHGVGKLRMIDRNRVRLKTGAKKYYTKSLFDFSLPFVVRNRLTRGILLMNDCT